VCVCGGELSAQILVHYQINNNHSSEGGEIIANARMPKSVHKLKKK
jgi:hypothetical protein